mgnify:FL=1
MVTVAVLVTSAVWAAPEDPVIIPDAALKSVVQEALGITDGRDPTEAEMATLTQLVGDNRGIADLTGIEYATNLTWLQVRNISVTAKISDLGPLSGLTNLTVLLLVSNQISDLSPLSGLTNLSRLDLRSNQITDLSDCSAII